MANPIVTIQMKDGGVMKVELYPEIAPITVKNFIDLEVEPEARQQLTPTRRVARQNDMIVVHRHK